MRTFSRFTRFTIFAVTLAAVAACGNKKKDGAASSDKPAEASDQAAPAGPLQMSAKQIFDEFNAPNFDAVAAIDKYKPGVVVTGTVTNTIAEENGFLHVWLDAGGNHHTTLDFKDQGAAAKSKGVKAGDQVTAQCSPGGTDGSQMMMIDCVLK